MNMDVLCIYMQMNMHNARKKTYEYACISRCLCMDEYSCMYANVGEYACNVCIYT
jgi:hypothetical protein